VEAPIPNSYWVTPGSFLAGEYPGELDERETAAKVDLLRRAGIDLFLDLTEEGEGGAGITLPPYAAAIAPAEHRRMAIRDLACPTRDEMRAILDAIDESLAGERRVYLHCWGGIGRTGTVVGCWLVRHGRTGADALAQIAEWRRETPDGRRRSPETDEQHALVLGWRPGE
jgi:hypothetical protein